MLIVLSLTGGERRWHTQPKVVFITAILLFIAIGLTLAAILLSQLFLTNYEGVCLTVAPVFSLAFFYDEIRATWNYLSQNYSNRKQLAITAFTGLNTIRNLCSGKSVLYYHSPKRVSRLLRDYLSL